MVIRMVPGSLLRLAQILAALSCVLSPVASADDPLPTVDQIYLAEQAGRYEDAQHMIERVLAARPKSAKAHYVQAELFARHAKTAQARSELKIAEQLQPNLGFAKPRALAELREQLGEGSQPREDRVLLASKNGILVAPVVLNNAIELNFFVDSGATDVSIPADLFSSMRRSGAIVDGDITGSRRFVNADGESSKATTFILRSLKIGGVEVSRVEASVAPAKAPLLLGQSFLKRFKSWSIDNKSQELVLQR
jgi:clan AA aspartic protease (TIGR02281 family)